MNAIYDFVTGPLAWLAWVVFIAGSIYRIGTMYALAKKKDSQALAYMKWNYSLRSIFNWMIPYNAMGWKTSPVTTAVTFVFHICLVLVPIFLLAHVVLWDLWFGISFPTLPDTLADTMTVLVIAACVYFGVRRIKQKEVAYVTQTMDWVILVIAILPFLTGFLAYHQIGDYNFMVILHIVTGELMLAAIPFTRISHMLFGWFTRAYLGSEFGGVRRCKDW